MSGAWVTALAEVAADLDRLEASFGVDPEAATGIEVATGTDWTPPADLGPLPEQLRGEAEQLTARIADLRARASAERQRLAGELQDAGRRRSAADQYLGMPAR